MRSLFVLTFLMPFLSSCALAEKPPQYDLVFRFEDADTGKPVAGVQTVWHQISYPDVGDFSIRDVPLLPSDADGKVEAKRVQVFHAFTFTEPRYQKASASIDPGGKVAITSPNNFQDGEVYKPSDTKPVVNPVVVKLVSAAKKRK